VEAHKATTAPLAMVAFAKVVAERIINDRQVDTLSYFDGLTMTVPPTNECMEEMKYHGAYALCYSSKRLVLTWVLSHMNYEFEYQSSASAPVICTVSLWKSSHACSDGAKVVIQRFRVLRGINRFM